MYLIENVSEDDTLLYYICLTVRIDSESIKIWSMCYNT